MQSGHAGKQSYKNAFLFFLLSIAVSIVCRHYFCHRRESVIANCLSKNTFSVPVQGKQDCTPLVKEYVSVFWDSISRWQFFFFVCMIYIFFYSTFLDSSRAGTSSKVIKRCRFVYQNIDLFSLYMSTLALTLDQNPSRLPR